MSSSRLEKRKRLKCGALMAGLLDTGSRLTFENCSPLVTGTRGEWPTSAAPDWSAGFIGFVPAYAGNRLRRGKLSFPRGWRQTGRACRWAPQMQVACAQQLRAGN